MTSAFRGKKQTVEGGSKSWKKQTSFTYSSYVSKYIQNRYTNQNDSVKKLYSINLTKNYVKIITSQERKNTEKFFNVLLTGCSVNQLTRCLLTGAQVPPKIPRKKFLKDSRSRWIRALKPLNKPSPGFGIAEQVHVVPQTDVVSPI